MIERVTLSKENIQYLVGLPVEVIWCGNEVMVLVSYTKTDTGESCAEWLFSELTKESPPDPEDEEETKLEPEEVTADAEGGNAG
jgi:hypothetical protein